MKESQFYKETLTADTEDETSWRIYLSEVIKWEYHTKSIIITIFGTMNTQVHLYVCVAYLRLYIIYIYIYIYIYI